MYHTLALTEVATTAVLTDLEPVLDEIIQVQNGHFLPPTDMWLYGAMALATDIQRVQVSTPRLRQVSPIFLRPLQPTLIGANDANVVLMGRNPLLFRGQEEITVEGLQDAGVNQRITVLLFLGDRLSDIAVGDNYVIRATSTTTVTANVWSQLSYTLQQSLPQGNYAVKCIEHISANGQCVRGIFDNQYYRPGAPSIVDVNQRLPYPWMENYLGEWGRFVTYSLPRIEVLCNAADASHELYFHIVKLPG